jgi:hypothetical protein
MDELNHAITQVIEEEVDKYHSCIDWLSFTARKPKDAQCDATFSPAKKERPVHLTEFASTSVIPLPPPPSTQSSSRASTPNH